MIDVKNLWKRYGKLQVLKGLNLTVIDGETLVILGRSGVGKSVLLKQIIGIEHPDEGSVEINGQEITDLRPSQREAATKGMGMLFQGSALFDSMNVEENTAFYLNEHEAYLGKKEIKERVAHALKMVDMEGTETKMPSDLSGGMRKRVALARLIVYRPRILLYDEPTTGLDPITAMHINELIIETQEALQATSIVVTHDIKSAMTVGDRLAFHHDGKIAHVTSKEKFMKIDDPILHDFFENATLKEGELLQQRKEK